MHISRQHSWQLGFTVLLGCIVNGVASQYSVYAGIGWWSLGFFTLLTVIAYWWALRTLRPGQRPTSFLGVVMGLTLGKMFLSVFLVWGYVSLNKPQDRSFLLLFFAQYLLFTILETIILMDLSRSIKRK